MSEAAFEHVISAVDELRSVYRAPGAGALRKEIDRIDENCRSFIAHSPLVMLGTSGPDGSCDVSPRGGPPGFVAVLDGRRLALPDLAGNNRLDSFSNVVDVGGAGDAGGGSAGVGLLFIIPGLDETLRVNGRAWLVQDPDVLDACVVGDVRPRVALGVEVSSAYIHCAKAFRRGGVWDPSSWPDRTDMPSVACMIRDHVGEERVSAEEIEAGLEAGYAKTMWRPGGEQEAERLRSTPT